MRKILLCTVAVSLSGCSFFGMGGSTYHSTAYNAAPVSSCPAHNCYARWNIENGAGVSSIVGGTAITGAKTNGLGGSNINDVTMDSAYKLGARAEAGISYALAPNTKVALLGHYERANPERDLDIGIIGGQNLRGNLSPYESIGAEMGLRHYLQPTRAPIVKSVRPYVEARLGVTHVDDIAIENARLGAAAFNGGRVALYDDSFVETGAALVGLETVVADYITVGVETGVRYRGELDADNSDIPPAAALAGANQGGSNYSIPLTLRGRFRF